MKRFVTTAALIALICASSGCANTPAEQSGAENSVQNSSISDSEPAQSSSAEQSDGADAEDTRAVEAQKYLTIENNVVTDCSSFLLGKLIIPDGVTEIGEKAFADINGLTEITIPSSVKMINFWAFENCTALKKITFTDGIKEIKSSAFSGCTALESIVMPDSVDLIYTGIFAGYEGSIEYKGTTYRSGDTQKLCMAVCYDENGFLIKDGVLLHAMSDIVSGDVVIPDGVTVIDEWALAYCDKINSITVPGSVKEVKSYAFAEISRLKELTFEEGVTTLGEYILNNSGASVIHLPSTLTNIPEYALKVKGNSTVYEYMGVEYHNYKPMEMGENPLYKLLCKLMPGYNEDGLLIEDGVLKDCLYCAHSYYEPLVIPEGVTAIADGAFTDPPFFSEIQFPETLTEIGEKSLWFTYIKSVEIPAGVKRLNDSAFTYCQNLKSVKLNEGLEEIGADCFNMCTDLEEINFPSTLKRIEDNAFAGCDMLTVTALPDSIEYVSDSAF